MSRTCAQRKDARARARRARRARRRSACAVLLALHHSWDRRRLRRSAPRSRASQSLPASDRRLFCPRPLAEDAQTRAVLSVFFRLLSCWFVEQAFIVGEAGRRKGSNGSHTADDQRRHRKGIVPSSAATLTTRDRPFRASCVMRAIRGQRL